MTGGRDMWHFWKPHNLGSQAFLGPSSSSSCKLSGPQVGATLLHKALWKCLKDHFLSQLEREDHWLSVQRLPPNKGLLYPLKSHCNVLSPNFFTPRVTFYTNTHFLVLVWGLERCKSKTKKKGLSPIFSSLGTAGAMDSCSSWDLHKVSQNPKPPGSLSLCTVKY